MRVLVGFEYTGIGRDAFTKKGCYAMSCDLDPSETPGPHYRGDIKELLSSEYRWDLAILHPECTKMAVCGNGTWANTPERDEAVDWTLDLWLTAISVCDRVCLENPQSVIFPVLREYGALVQYVQPHEFGHPETKKTGLALHNLEPLQKTWDVSKIMSMLPKKERHKTWYASPSETRGKDRSRSYPGILRAMAEQWVPIDTRGISQ